MCGLRCHWPRLDHNAQCSVPIASPCPHHRKALTCTRVFAVAKLFRKTPQPLDTIDDAMALYRCQEPVDVEMPCSHSIRVTCAEEHDYSTGALNWPMCSQPALRPYVYACGHDINLTCSVFTDWERTPSFVTHCKAQVLYRPKCGHEKKVACYLKDQYECGAAVLTCNEMMQLNLPRCGHSASVPCKRAAALDSWTGNTLGSEGIVYEGQPYGPKDSTCKNTVLFQRKCGHEISLQCSGAFDMAQHASRCDQKETIINPECGHPFTSTCIQKQTLQAAGALTSVRCPVTIVNEDDVNAFGPPCKIALRCSVDVTLIRKCGHEEKMTCAKARKPARCCVQVTVTNPLCNHPVIIPCHLRGFNGWGAWPPGFMVSPSWTSIQNGIFHDNWDVSPSTVPTALSSYISKCSVPVELRRASGCGHSVWIPCFQAIACLRRDMPVRIPECDVVLSEPLSCGHSVSFKCCLRDVSLKEPCSETVERQCWNFDICRATVIQPCHLAAHPTCATLSLWTCEAGHRFKYPQCSEGVPEQCPSCIQHHLDEDIRLLDEDERPPIDPDVLTADLDESKLTSLRCLPRNEGDVRCNLLVMLLNFRDWLLSMDDAWLRPVYRRAVTKWFIPVNDSGKDFRLSDHVKPATLHGVQVYPWTRPNIEGVLLSRKQSGARSDLHFVIGVAFTCHVLVDPPDIPKGPAPRSKGSNKQKLKAQQQAKDMLVQSKQWVQQHRKNGFDAVQRHLKDGSTTLVLWDPFALSASHAICASHDTISAVASSLPEDVDLGPVYIQAKALSQQQRTTAVSSTNVDFRERHREHLDMLLATRLSGLQFGPWDGRLFTRGNKDAAPSLEARLIAKLQFTKSDATESPPSTGGPFGGLEYLKTLSASLKVPELQLFRCLELLHLDFAADAEHEFQEYVHSVDSRRAHPLTIVAAARLAKNSNPAESRACLTAFVKCYEDCAKDWLTPDELACLEQSTGVGDVLPDVTSQSAKSLWEQLKESERCHSDAMEELLALTGLKKVKTEAVLIFKSALVRNKMDAEKRRKNAMTLNFCFLGNPGQYRIDE